MRTRPSQRAAASMGAKKASDAAVEELLSPDYWEKDNCSVCHEDCPTREMKIAHVKTPRHAKKLLIFKFLTNDATALTVTRPSKLVERYKDKGYEGIGLDCIHELVFPFAESGWWACSLCNEAGFNYEQIDEHLVSVRHLQHFLEEFHPVKAKKMHKDWSQTERLEFLLDAKKQIYYELMKKGANLVAPEIIDLPSWTLTMARKRLGVDDTEKEYAVHAVAEDSSNVMMQCQTCHVTLPCRKDCVADAWTRHHATERHKRLATINYFLRQYDFEREQEEDRLLSELSDEGLRWKHVDHRVYGPVCGVKYLRRMGKTSLCSLCGVIVESVDEHFASEIHLARFVCTQSPREGWQMMMTSREMRREKLLTMIQSSPRENEESRWTREECPSRLTWSAVESEEEQLPSFPPPQEPFGFNSACFFCSVCWLSLPTPDGEDPNVVWNEHVFANDHLDFFARRYTIDYDDAYFVPLVSSVQLLPAESHGKWVTESVGEQVAWKYQTQTDVGLEYVVEDADQGMAVCTLCARSYALGESCMMGRHVRSVQHLQQYMHVVNRTMLSMVVDTKIETAADELMLEFIQRNSVSGLDEIRVFNKKKSKELESWPSIKLRTMQICTTAPDIRPIYDCVLSMVDQVANDKEEERSLCAREALHAAQVKEITVTRMVLLKIGLVLFKCGTCNLSFTANASQLEQDVWERHIGSEDHFRRALAFANNKFSPLYFTPLSSTYTVKPFVQKDPTKKVTWRWNPLDKAHDLVLSVVGLEELVEKKSEDSMVMNDANIENFSAHFFCRVCAVVVGRRAQMLEDHVRSAAHVIAYVNKHYPQTILELERLDSNDGGKERRKILANLLKDIKPPAEYCIPVYDPIGESERRQKEAELKHKQREAMRKNEEMRQKAMEERKKKDEERRKTKEEEVKREREREEERKKREAAVLEKAAAMSAERERLRKLAMEKAALAEIARKKEELINQQAQLTRDPGIAALLSKRAAISSQLEALRAAKAGGAPPEPRLLIPGPNQLASTPASATMHNLPTVRISGAPLTATSQQQPQPLMGTILQPMQPMQQQQPSMAFPPPGAASMYSMPPPMGGGGMGMGMGMGVPPPSMTSYNMPPPSLMSVPPPSMGVPPPSMMSAPPPGLSGGGMGGMYDLVGPKPVISTFVPKVDAMPVYPNMGAGGPPGLLRRKGDFERPSLAGAAPDMYATNPAIITSRQALVDYMWKQGNEETPESERPARFSRLCAATPACLGMEYIYEVVCVDSGDLTTMYCSMCAFWSTPMDTVKHMLSPTHRLLYLFRNYKLYHSAVESEVDQRAKEILLEQFSMQIRSRDNPPPCITHRLKCFLNTATIQRLWPQYVNFLDQTWRSNPVCRTPSPPPRRRRSSRSRSYSSSDSRSRSYSRSRSRSPKDRHRRSRSRDRDHHHSRRRSRDSRSRSPRRGRGSRRRSDSRSRSGTPMNKTWQPESMGNNGSTMGMGGGMGFAPNTTVPPPSLLTGIMPNMSMPPPGLMAVAPVGVPPLAKTTTVITLDDEDMQISTTPSPKEKREEKRREKEKEKKEERGREKEAKPSTPRRDRSKSRDRSRRDGGRREKDRKKEKEEEVDPIREEQRKKALEKVRELDRAKREQKEKEREKKMESTEDRLRRDRRERSRERKRSPSPSRKRKRSESRERRSSHRSSNGGDGGGGEGDWDSKAAAFLAKIGDLAGASKLIQGVGSSKPSAAAPPVYTGAPSARPSSGMGGYEPLTASPSDFGGVGKRKKDASSPAYEPLFEESAAPSSSRGPSAAAAASAEDAETTKRKLLGVLVTMQQETEAGRELSEKDVDRIYNEVGLSSRDRNSEMLAQLIEMVGGDKASTKKPTINLQDYGIAPSASPAARHGSPYYGGPPPAGYGRDGRGDYYGGSPRDHRAPPAHSGLDAGDFELLKNLRSTLKLMQTIQVPPSGGPRSLPMPPGFGRPEYDRREPYPPSSVYPPYRSPADEDPRLRRPSVYDDPRYMDPRDPRADPRMRDRYPPDPRYRGYYDDAYDPRDPRALPPPSGYGAYDPRDPRGAPPLRPGMDPRDPRDPREAHATSRPPMGGVDSRLYEPPPRPREERPVLTREEYEARLRGEIPATQPTGSAPKPPPAATAAAAPPPAAAPAKKVEEVTIDDDDDWGSLEHILDPSKAPTAAAAAAPATGSNRQPVQTARKNGAPAAADAAAAAGTMTEKEAQKMQYVARVRQQWGVKNKAEPQLQPHLTGRPHMEPVGFPTATRAPPQHQQQQQAQLQQQQQQLQQHHHQPAPSGAVATGGQWDAAYAAPQRPQQQQQQLPQHLQPQQHQQQQQPQQGYYDQYGQNGGGYNANYRGGGGYY